MKSLFIFCFLLFPLGGFAQGKKLDLDDLTIRGELLGDDRLLILSRQRTDMKNIIKFRENYRKEILEELPSAKQKKKF
jgi:hypothetical protein